MLTFTFVVLGRDPSGMGAPTAEVHFEGSHEASGQCLMVMARWLLTTGCRAWPRWDFKMTNAWQFFMGYRFGVFNYATQALGGAVKVASFELATP